MLAKEVWRIYDEVEDCEEDTREGWLVVSVEGELLISRRRLKDIREWTVSDASLKFLRRYLTTRLGYLTKEKILPEELATKVRESMVLHNL